MTHANDTQHGWIQFLEYVESHCSKTAFGNWIAPIKVSEISDQFITLEVPNIFVKEYLLSNYKKDLAAFLPVNKDGDPSIKFLIAPPEKKAAPKVLPTPVNHQVVEEVKSNFQHDLNPNYRFENFIEGPANQFVKSAAVGIAAKPGQSYNPMIVYGGVGRGKTHILHSIGHYVREKHKKLRVQIITTEQFINDLVYALRNKEVDKMKKFYRNEIDVLLWDDMQFLENRRSFDEEVALTIEALINQGKQVVIASDKPPAQLKLSERLIARMEWGLVAHMGAPELETRVAILLSKAEQKGLVIPQKIAFNIAEHIYQNVRQLEGAVNKLSAYSRLLNMEVSEELVEKALREMFQAPIAAKVSVEQILKSTSAVFDVRISALKGTERTKKIALARQAAMYLACKLINESLEMIAASFGKTHSTLLHAKKNIEEKLTADDTLRRQISMIENNIASMQ